MSNKYSSIREDILANCYGTQEIIQHLEVEQLVTTLKRKSHPSIGIVVPVEFPEVRFVVALEDGDAPFDFEFVGEQIDHVGIYEPVLLGKVDHAVGGELQGLVQEGKLQLCRQPVVDLVVEQEVLVVQNLNVEVLQV